MPGQHRRVMAEQRGEPRIGGGEATVAADHQQCLRRGIEQCDELLPRMLAPAGVLRGGEEAVDVAVRPALRLETQVESATVGQ